MDMLENKKIREKINALDELPETYHPNMASKWSLLEAGLDGKDNDNRKAIAWKRIAVAAVLLMMAGSAFVLLNYKETSQISERSMVIKNASTTLNASTPLSMTEQPIQKVKEESQPIKKSNRKKVLSAPVKEEDKIAIVLLKDSIVQPLAPEKETAMLTVTPKAKKRRFIELDFNDDVYIDKPVEPVTASHKFSFKIGTDKASGSEDNAGGLAIRLPGF